MPGGGTRTPGYVSPATLHGLVAGRPGRRPNIPAPGSGRPRNIGAQRIVFDVVRNSYSGAEQQHGTSGLPDVLGNSQPGLAKVRTPRSRALELGAPQDIRIQYH